MNKDYPIPGKPVYFPPVHAYQQWEEFEVDEYNVPEMEQYTYQNEYHAVYTIQLAELIESGVFDWARPEIDWSSAAYDEEQYERVCAYFIERFKYREISALPVKEWFNFLHRKLVYEVMPKYKPLYERVADGIDPLQDSNEYFKNRRITSAYPQTQLSSNSDYITDGLDEEYQRIKETNLADVSANYAEKYKGVDELVLDELESLFISMYTSFVNSW